MGRKKLGPPRKGGAQGVMPLPPLPDDAAADVDIDDDDVAFIHSHRRQLQRLANTQLEEAPCVHLPLRRGTLLSHARVARVAPRRAQSWKATQKAHRRRGR